MSDELEKICGNCNYFFPNQDTPTIYGICLEDPAFEPYIDDILEGREHICQDLIRSKSFDMNSEGCAKFSPVEVEEIDFGEDMPWEENEDFLLPYVMSELPVESLDRDLSSQSEKKRIRAVVTLGSLMIMGNEQARTALIKFLKELGPPSTLEEVHFKKIVLERFPGHHNDQELLNILLDDLELTHSNNTTRPWFTSILHFLRMAPLDLIQDRIQTMIQKGTFSYRLKKRIESMLEDMREEENFHITYPPPKLWPEE